ncbi:prolyl aminopeptidase [Methylovulum psychrotolerans]|uniref:Proline iminopeptidase n=1 Tax=Methylovulum psychrotolerans TaxID=1704499 RepID=A0A1Z4BYT0_9GAMM|nr:prolyl aminopeptidase [Methylovulum psychrotolerans]ASF46438.1 prolyl aminopeptidase [Methylovulum psychrotolerans]
MKTLYPELQPFRTFFLETSSPHSVYVEQSGNPDGIPVVFLHGGPCSGTKPDHRRFFNPERYHIILFDQRACGQSLPFGELEGNTTQDLLDDMERIRQHLKLEQWLVFGGSWGGALALLYAQQYPVRVSGLVIRAVFLARQQDLDWYAKDGANRIFPEQWQKLLDSLPDSHTGDLLATLYVVFWGEDTALQTRVAKEWLAWGALTALGTAYPSRDMEITGRTFEQIRMELNFARHRYFIAENQILTRCGVLQAIPTRIIHGRQDFLCPLEAGHKLHQALPNADYVILPNAGHVAQHEEMIDALVTATDDFVRQGDFGTPL